MPRALLFLTILTLCIPRQTEATDRLILGKLTVDPPTLINLGFSWEIEGDTNRNASATVEYRPVDDPEWREALPLLRTGGYHVGRHTDLLDQLPPPRLAGSILDLEPETEYEVRITATDPDGIEGEAVQTVTVATRGEPKAAEGGRVYHLYPPYAADGKTRLKNAAWPKGQYTSLYKAYYGGIGNIGDFNMVWPRIIEPGDTILVHAGLYKADLQHYTDQIGLVADGTYWLTAKGTAEKPIVIKAAGDGEVIFDGAGADVLFNVMATEHHIFEGITFRNCGVAFFAGQQRVGGAKGLTIRNCRFEDVRDGIFSLYSGSENFYIADNVILGRNDREALTGWGGREDGYLKSNTGITLQGSGHVVCRNVIAYFWQGYHMGTNFQGYDRGGVSCDLYQNDLHQLIDDGFEIDGSVRNIRVMRNRIVNSGTAFSIQPIYGGPAYLIGNVAYNNRLGYKIHEAHPSGFYLFHNTVVGGHFTSRGLFTNAHFRNNLFLGHDSHEPTVILPDPANDVSSSSNGYDRRSRFQTTPHDGTTPIVETREGILWPAKRYPPKSKDRSYASLEEFQESTGFEAESLLIDPSDFRDLPRSEGQEERHATRRTYHGADLDFALNPESEAVDAGVLLANVNEGHQGEAPDLGARELGSEPVQYGPRWLDGDFDFREQPEEGEETEETDLDPVVEGLKKVTIASVSDAVEQITGNRGYMNHDVRPLEPAQPGENLVGPAVTIQLMPNEKTDAEPGFAKALAAIDEAEPGSVVVVDTQDLNMTGIGGLMAYTCLVRGLAGAVIDGAARDVDEINALDFPVYSRSIAPSTVMGHFTAVDRNVPILCGGVPVKSQDLIVAGNDGVVVVPRAHAEAVLQRAIEIDEKEAAMLPLIESEKSIRSAVDRYNRL